jgi:two-component system sensor histidine kinase YesM
MYIYLLDIVSRKGERVDLAYLEAVGHQIDRNLTDVFSLAEICANDPVVLQAVSRQDRQAGVRDLLNAQERLHIYLQSNPAGTYIDKLILFDNRQLFVQAVGRQPGGSEDTDAIRQLPLYSRLTEERLPWTSGFGRSIYSFNSRDSFMLLFRVRGDYHNQAEAYLYVEAGLNLITDVFREFMVPSGVFAQVPQTRDVIPWNNPRLVRPSGKYQIPDGTAFPYRFRQDGRSWRLDRLSLDDDVLFLYNQVDVTNLTADDRQVLYIVLTAVLMSLIAAVALGLTLSAFVIRPIRVLINRIRRIAESSDFSHDPEIEKKGDEISLIGRAVNEMSGSLQQYLLKMEEYYQERKKTEFALLQTQINPHFIYNTLDSIQWMAKLQNSPAIADLSRSLINLLQSITLQADAAGTNVKITLAEEIRILKDYCNIMSVRFMGSFEMENQISESFLDCRIPKFTLQPLVENAIVHGIEPSGRFGVITLTAAQEGNYLVLTVADTGVGMSRNQIENIKTQSREKQRGSPSMNNIGIMNVDERLKLLYGESCGLSFESGEGEYTKVHVRILKEQ